MSDWFYVVGLGMLAFLVLLLGSSIRAGALSSTVDWATGILAVVLALVAGTYAQRTWIGDLAQTIVGSSDLVHLVFFGAAIALVAATVAALMHDRVSTAVSVTPVLALAWVLVPSFLAAGVIPGRAGVQIQQVVTAVSTAVAPQTRIFG